MIDEITVKELEGLFRNGEEEIRNYADKLEDAILKCLVEERDTIAHLIEIGHYPEGMEVFNSMPVYITMNELFAKSIMNSADSLKNKPSVFRDRLVDILGEKGLLMEEVKVNKEKIDNKKEVVFFFDFDEDISGRVKDFYLEVTKGKFEWLIGQINSSLRYKAKKMERELTIWFNGKNSFPELTHVEYREIQKYYQERGFRDLGVLKYSHEDLSEIKLKISF